MSARAAPTAGSRWRSRRSSPTIPKSTLAAARKIPRTANVSNLYVESPERRRTIAIEEAIFAGIPVNVTLLFSREQYLAVAEA